MSIISSVDAVANSAQFQIFSGAIDLGTFTVNVPTSQVALTAVPLNHDILLAEWQSDLRLIKIWLDLVTTVFNPLNVIPATYNDTLIKNVNTVRKNNIVDNYIFDTRYNISAGTVTIFARLATILTWGDFLLFYQFNNKLLLSI